MELTMEATLAQPRQGKIARFFILILFLNLGALSYRTEVKMGSDLQVHLSVHDFETQLGEGCKKGPLK